MGSTIHGCLTISKHKQDTYLPSVSGNDSLPSANESIIYYPTFINSTPIIRYPERPVQYVLHLSDGGGRVCGGEVLHPDPCYFLHWRRRVEEAAGKRLPTGLTKVLRKKGVQDRINARVAVGQAVRYDAECKGGIV